MRLATLLLLPALLVVAQDPSSTDAAAAADPNESSYAGSGDKADNGGDLTPAEDTGTPTGVIDLPPTLPSGPWNITYFIAPTRNNYWVNDNDNTAAWAPLNAALNLFLTNSNKSIMSSPVLLVQNLAPGTSNYKSRISNVTPGNNYIVYLTMAGNPDQKLAQTQGFHIKPNSTAVIQQVESVPVGSASVAIPAGGAASPSGTAPAGASGVTAPGATNAPGNPGSPPPGTTQASGATAAATVGFGVAFLAFTLVSIIVQV